MIILGDAIEEMSKLPDNSIDLVVVDLPYGLTKNEKDKTINLELFWKEISRIKKSRTPICLFAQGIFYIDLVNSKRGWFRYDLIWDKVLTTGFLNAKRMPLRKHEQIAVFYENTPVYNPQFTKGIPLHSMGKSYKEKINKNQNYGYHKPGDDARAGSCDKYPTSIIKFQKPHPANSIHRTQKPLELLEWLVSTYSNKGDLVLDCTAGSGTTGLACKNLDRNWILIDNDPICYDIMMERLS
jgi:site-specific DNA-methyltransferase (adenine-specific)